MTGTYLFTYEYSWSACRAALVMVVHFAVASTMQASAMPAHCDARRFHNFSAALDTIGTNPAGGTIVNLGATLGRGGTKSSRSNNDEAWNFFFDHPDLKMRVIAFEGSAKAINETKAQFRTPGGHYELTMEMQERVELIHAYVQPKTVVRELERRGLPVGFLLLKVDIDSVDLEAFAAITERFRPKLAWVERTDWAHTKGTIFSALSQCPEQVKRARYSEGINGGNANYKFACHGSSSMMWRTFHERFIWLSEFEQQQTGRSSTSRYEVVQSDLQKNYLLVQSSDAGKFGGSTDRQCFGEIEPDVSLEYHKWKMQ